MKSGNFFGGLIALVTVTIGTTLGQLQCTQSNFDTCVSPYYNFFTLANVTEAVLNEGCGALNNVSQCMKNFGCVDKPISDPNKAWNGLKSATTYVCSKKSDVLKNWPCWKRVLEVSNQGVCYDGYVIDKDKPNQVPCYAVNRLVQCMKSNITITCGAEAGDLYGVYYYKQFVEGTYDVNSTCSPEVPVTTKKPDSSSANPESRSSILNLFLFASVVAFLISAIRN